MEGKAVLFKEFGGVDAFPICIDAHDAASVIAACKAIAPTFGGINLEDIKSPECFEIEETLERELDIPVFHDDQHGTAIVVTAALINALRVVGKKMEDVHIVLNGPGAAGTAIIKMLMTAGAKDIIAVDQFGTLYKGCNSAEAHKNWLGVLTNLARNTLTEKSDQVVTTGLGGVFPADLLVGVVQELVPEVSGKSTIAVIKPGTDPRTVRHAFIITSF